MSSLLSSIHSCQDKSNGNKDQDFFKFGTNEICSFLDEKTNKNFHISLGRLQEVYRIDSATRYYANGGVFSGIFYKVKEGSHFLFD